MQNFVLKFSQNGIKIKNFLQYDLALTIITLDMLLDFSDVLQVRDHVIVM